jgi:hypothetical protein
MSTEQVWIIARRVLGAYFLITGALYVPAALMAFGIETTGVLRWPLVVAPLLQGMIAIVAGWRLLQTAAPPADSDTPGGARKTGSMVTVLQLMGVYFVVVGLAEAVELAVNMYFFGEAWEIRLGAFTSAVVKLLAGALLVAKPSVLVARIAIPAPRV